MHLGIGGLCVLGLCFIAVGYAILKRNGQRWWEEHQQEQFKKMVERRRDGVPMPSGKNIIDQAWERQAAAAGVSVDELKQRITTVVQENIQRQAAEAGISVEEMQRRLHLDMLLLTLGPNCLTNDDALALREGGAIPEHQRAHVERCDDCKAYITAAQKKRSLPWSG